eukprot:SAG22_NODE_2697_length_2304_cov_5.536054_3_plen_48_part_01
MPLKPALPLPRAPLTSGAGRPVALLVALLLAHPAAAVSQAPAAERLRA